MPVSVLPGEIVGADAHIGPPGEIVGADAHIGPPGEIVGADARIGPPGEIVGADARIGPPGEIFSPMLHSRLAAVQHPQLRQQMQDRDRMQAQQHQAAARRWQLQCLPSHQRDGCMTVQT